MARINVENAFTLYLDHGHGRHFPVGEQDVDDATAAHWYVQAHSSPVAVAAPAEIKAKAKAKG
jgi:hypothetical protein